MNQDTSTFIVILFVVLIITLIIYVANANKNDSNNLSTNIITPPTIQNNNNNNNTDPQTTITQPSTQDSSTTIAGCNTCSLVSLPYTSTITNSTGTKRALLFGCNYNFPNSICISQGCVLNGCIDDVNNIRSFLLSKGFLSSDIQMYIDYNTYNTDQFPTKALMKSKITEIVQNTQAGDTSFIWYSGHGSQIQNASADGGYNECWCPPDTLVSGDYLTDQELNQCLQGLVSGAKLFIGSDSCHSGTVFDLSYYVAEQNKLNYRNLINRNLKRDTTTIPQLKGNTVYTKIINFQTDKSLSDFVLVKDTFYSNTIQGLVITLSGCQDADTSADTFENGSAQGAMTWSFLTTINTLLLQNPSSTLQDLLIQMRNLLGNNGYTQIPQIEFSLPIDPKTTIQNAMF